MALLFPPQSVPAVMRVILEAVSRKDANLSDADAIVESIAPREIGGERGGVVRDSYVALRTLDLISTDGDTVVDDAVYKAIDHRGSLRGAWRTLLLARVLAHPTATDSIVAADDHTSGVRDLVLALTWCLAQDAAGPVLAWNPRGDVAGVQELQVRQAGTTRSLWPFSNDTRFRTMERWAAALGFVVTEADGVRPFPLNSVRNVVHDMEPGERPIGHFCEELGNALPILWPGVYRRQLVERLGKDPDPDVASDGVDSSVALALLALEEERLMRLKPLSDAERLQLGSASTSPRRVSHVEVLG